MFAFTRTADEPDHWVFLSMKDAQTAKLYDTPAKTFSALPCLDSRK